MLRCFTLFTISMPLLCAQRRAATSPTSFSFNVVPGHSNPRRAALSPIFLVNTISRNMRPERELHLRPSLSPSYIKTPDFGRFIGKTARGGVLNVQNSCSPISGRLFTDRVFTVFQIRGRNSGHRRRHAPFHALHAVYYHEPPDGVQHCIRLWSHAPQCCACQHSWNPPCFARSAVC